MNLAVVKFFSYRTPRLVILFLVSIFLVGHWSCQEKEVGQKRQGKAPSEFLHQEVSFVPPREERPPLSSYVRSYLAIDTPLVALQDLTLIDGRGGIPLRHQTVVIQENLIKAIGPNDALAIPEETLVLSLSGHTLIPGIVGTHNHTHMPGIPLMPYTAPRLYLACGVTTIQTTGSASPYAEMNLAASIRRGDTPGPDILHSSPYFSGPGGSPVMIIPESKAQVIQAVRYWVSEGVTWFKAYRHITSEHLQTLIEEAHRLGAKVTGHLCSVTYAEAARMGIDAIEHGLMNSMDHASDKEAGQCSGGRAFRNELAVNSPEVRAVQQILIGEGVALSSTLAIFEAQTVQRGIADSRTLAAMAPFLQREYTTRRTRMVKQGENWYYKEHWLLKEMEYVYAFYKAGGLLTAGLDPGLHNLPGYGDQRNYELLVEAGFKPAEAIQVMTSNGAKLLDKPQCGEVTVGKQADLVVINGDIEDRPASIRNVRYVFKNGYGFNPR